MFRHDSSHIGYSTSNGPSTNQTLWTCILPDGEEWADSPAVANGMLYISGCYGGLYAINASTGNLAWIYPTNANEWGYGAWLHAPAVSGGIVYMGSADYNIYAINATNGSLVWNYTTGSEVRSSPTLAYGIVYVSSMDCNLYALNASTGALVWEYNGDDYINTNSSPAVADDIVYIGSGTGSTFGVYALNAFTGACVWRSMANDMVESAPVVADGKVFVVAFETDVSTEIVLGYSCVCALDSCTGTLVWKCNIAETGTYVPVPSSPSVAYGKVFVGSANNNVYALDEFTGALIWKYTTGDMVDSSPAVAGGIVYITSNDGTFYALDASAGTLIWSYTQGAHLSSSPAVTDGVVYVGGLEAGGLIAVCAFGGQAPPSTYSVTINAHCNTEGKDINVGITEDGLSAGFTPHTFTVLTGTHTFIVPNTDMEGHPFEQWDTGETGTVLTVSSDGTYTAYYQASAPPPTGCVITFSTTGLNSTVNGYVLNVDGTNYTGTAMPVTFQWNGGALHWYNYTPIVGTTSQSFRLTSVDGPTSPFTVTHNMTITGNYQPSNGTATRTAGVRAGDWANYNVSMGAYSGTIPPSFVEIESGNLSVTSVSDHNVALSILVQYKNGSSSLMTCQLDVNTGEATNGPNFFLIATGLGAGEDENNFKMNGTSIWQYNGQDRPTVYSNSTLGDYIWDQTTGLLIYAKLPQYSEESITLPTTMELQLVDTNAFVVISPSSTGTLQVLVRDMQGNPLGNAIVTMTVAPTGQTLESRTTNSSGLCTFQGVKAGSYSIQASVSGYSLGNGSATVQIGQTAIIGLLLSPGPVVPFSFPLQFLGEIIGVILAVVAAAVIIIIIRRRRNRARQKQPSLEKPGKTEPYAGTPEKGGKSKLKKRRPNLIPGLIVIGAGVALLVFTLVTAYGLVRNDFSVGGSASLGTLNVLLNLFVEIIRVCTHLIYLGLMLKISATIISRGMTLTKPEQEVSKRGFGLKKVLVVATIIIILVIACFAVVSLVLPRLLGMGGSSGSFGFTPQGPSFGQGKPNLVIGAVQWGENMVNVSLHNLGGTAATITNVRVNNVDRTANSNLPLTLNPQETKMLQISFNYEQEISYNLILQFVDGTTANFTLPPRLFPSFLRQFVVTQSS